MIYTLCGSTRFPDAFALANAHLSMMGHVVIGLGLYGHADEPRGARFLTSDGDESTPEKQGLDQLHFRKIDLSDAIYVVNVGGYVGSSTKREIAYAEQHGKTVEWMFPPVTVVEAAQGRVDDLERVIDVMKEAAARILPRLRRLVDRDADAHDRDTARDEIRQIAEHIRRGCPIPEPTPTGGADAHA